MKVYNHFKSLITEEVEEILIETTLMLQEIPSLVIDKDNVELEHEIEEQEVRQAIWVLEPGKTLRPNGFYLFFYRQCSNIIKMDLCKMLRWTRKNKKVGGGVNSFFLILIPK